MPTISTTLLFLNSLWDLLSFVAISARIRLGRCLWLADAHLGLWVRDEDRENHAASAIMAILLLQWSLTRMLGALSGPTSDAACFDASATYLLEAALVAVETMFGNMHALSGWFVVTMSAVCWSLVVRECVES